MDPEGLSAANPTELQELRVRVREFERALAREEAFHHEIRAAIEPEGHPGETDDDLLVLYAQAGRELLEETVKWWKVPFVWLPLRALQHRLTLSQAQVVRLSRQVLDLRMQVFDLKTR